MDKDAESSDTRKSAAAAAPHPSTYPRRNVELFQYLMTTFQAFLPEGKAEQFNLIAEELTRSVEDNCQTCRLIHTKYGVKALRDPRRSRFLLRVVVGRVSSLFTGETAPLPRSLIEGLDRYLKKAFGDMIYGELDAEADELVYRINCDDDEKMWEAIRSNPQWRRFVDTIFLRILFRFENFPAGKKTFMSIVDRTMQESSPFVFNEEHFLLVFEALFSDLWGELQKEEQRIRWDFMFGDGTSKKIETILKLGLVNWFKRKDVKVLASGRVAGGAGPSLTKGKLAATLAAKKSPSPAAKKPSSS